MLLGIDVGGTHTDAVVIGRDGIEATAKVRTDQDNLLNSILEVLEKVRQAVPSPDSVERLNLSTTLTTNALVQGKLEDVGVLVTAGPGISPQEFMLCRDYHVIDGAMDHRGHEIRPLDQPQARQAVKTCLDAGCRSFAVAGKFSTRNPDHEQALADIIRELDPDTTSIVTLGHEMTGRLNFPRRIATAYFNSAVWRRFNNFLNAVTDGLDALGFTCKVNILKADGGTLPINLARAVPVESILSGPAASVMGTVAMCDILLDSVILDIGGTTTDMAVFAQGAPLAEPDGIHIGSHATLVRALYTRSIGIGGDSAVRVVDGQVRVGPERLGPPLALDGQHPALMDAFNVLGKTDFGDTDASQRGLEKLAAKAGLSAQELAAQAVGRAVATIKQAVADLVAEVNARPVYTIHELLEGRSILPRKLYVMGGPAKAFEAELFKAFQLSVTVPRHYDVANAVGAALSRTTRSLELFADTDRQLAFAPSISFEKRIERSYSLADAQKDAQRLLLTSLRDEGIPAREENVQLTHASSFNMVEGYHTAGRNIRVACQVKPGVLHKYKQLLGKMC